MAINYFQQDYPELASNLTKVSRLMKEGITLKNKPVKNAIFDIFDGGGKMLRSAYLLLFSEFSDLSDKQMLALAAAIEMLHTATLVHDDIVDGAKKRRGVETISSKYGTDVAVYAGDYLFVVAFKLLAQNSFDLEKLADHAHSIENLLNGELGQMDKRFDTEQSITDYLENVSGKTGELFALAASVPLYASSQNRLAKKAYKIGLNIGIAFQVMDDYLDYTAESSLLGKPVLEDVREGVFTAPLLFALDERPREAQAFIEDKNYAQLLLLIQDSSALEKTKNLAKSYTDKALSQIEKLPTGGTRENLIKLTSGLLERVL